VAAAPLGRRAPRRAAALSSAIESALALVDPELRAEKITKLAGGIVSAVFEVAMTDGRSVVAKVYPDHAAPEREVAVLRLLEERRLAAPIPAVLAVDESRKIVVLTKLEGEALRSRLDLHEHELVEVNRQVGAFLRSLHDVDCDRFGDAHDANLDFMRAQFAARLGEFRKLRGDDPLRRRIADHVADRDELFAGCRRAVLCHNDCHDANVLVVGTRVSGVLDFEGAVAADPLFDLAKSYCYSSRQSEELLVALVEGYGDVRDGWRDTFDLYVLYHLLQLWDFYAALGITDPLAELAEELRLRVA
jgi:aminoglycoside phosphotransferase (APT) family kinase protein